LLAAPATTPCRAAPARQLQGGQGTDTYTFASGWGEDIIEDSDVASSHPGRWRDAVGRQQPWPESGVYDSPAPAGLPPDSVTPSTWMTPDAVAVFDDVFTPADANVWCRCLARLAVGLLPAPPTGVVCRCRRAMCPLPLPPFSASLPVCLQIVVTDEAIHSVVAGTAVEMIA